MSSIIEGYNYDIFISYRQKDNKHDGWVTEFVENLKGELESTFKEEISVYFDINPHDGLLETHDVDESLKGKLKCLIFIPIISRTYCDPKAFAWEYEFMTFVEQSSKDQYGLKIKLPNGNVANRVLPIIIYDLDKQDIKLCETVLGGVLRGVEFIYKTAGVNRPLRSKEEKPHDNLNDTLYRDQVNKVANTIKDVLNSLTQRESSINETISELASVDEKISDKRQVKKKPSRTPSVSFFHRVKKLTTFSQTTWRLIALAFIIVSFGAMWLYLNKIPLATDRAEHRYNISITENLGSTGRKALAISPDGEHLVYCMNGVLNLILLNSDAPSQPISGTTYPNNPFFSPDGLWIGFENTREGKIMKIPITGGNPVAVCDLEETTSGIINWQGNDIIFGGRTNIYRVPDAGGIPELLYPLIKSESDPRIVNFQLLPDKKTLLFGQRKQDGGYDIVTWKLGSKENPSVQVENGQYGRYLNSGHLVYSLNGQLYICKFNSRTNRKISEPQIIATNPIFGSRQFDFSDNGILVYYEYQQTDQYNLVWVDEAGTISPPITSETNNYFFAAISSDAKDIAADIPGEGTRHVEIINVKTGNSTLFAENAWSPSWSAGDSTVYYISFITRNQVYQKPLNLSTPPVMLFEIDSATSMGLYGTSSDGKYLLFDATFGPLSNDNGYYDIINDTVVWLEHYNFPGWNDHLPAISPDGNWIAYVSNYNGQVAIYVAPFPGPGQPQRVTSPRSNNDIRFPVWDPDTTALYYCTYNPDFELWKINMQFSENDFSYEPAQSFFNGGDNFNTGYDLEIHPSGDRFLLRQIVESGTEETIEPRINVIVNWEQELEGN